MDDADAHLRVLDLLDLTEERLDGALDVALQHDVQVLDLAGLQVVVERLERDATSRALRELLAAQPLGAHVREVLRLPLVLDDADELAGGRRMVEAEDFDGLTRPCLFHLLTAIVVERAHLAGRVPGHGSVSDVERPAMHEHRRDRPATDVEPRLDDDPRGLGVRVRAQVELGVRDEQDLLEQVVEVLLLLRGDGGELRRPAPVLRLQPLRRELALHAVDVRVGDVHLVHGDDDRHLGGAGMGDRLLRLRHDAVVRSDDEHGDVRHLGAAGAHGGERLMAGRVEERDPTPVDLGLVRADVLRDPARLGLDDRGLADRVEQRRLAVIDVAHDRDDRRARRKIGLGVVVRRRLELFLGCVLDRDLALELGADDLDLFVRERLRRRPHLSEPHQDLDELGHGDTEGLREVLDGDAGLDRDRARRRRCRRLARLRRRARAIAGLTACASPSAALDDDAPLAPAGALAGSYRAVRSLASVCHRRPV